MTGIGVALGAVGFVITGEPLWIAAGAVAGATLEWLERSKRYANYISSIFSAASIDPMPSRARF